MEQKKNAKSTEMETLKMSIESVPPPSSLRRSIAIRPMVLMGSGPTNVSQRVHDVLNKPHMGIYQHEIYQVNEIVRKWKFKADKKKNVHIGTNHSLLFRLIRLFILYSIIQPILKPNGYQ